MQNPSKKAEVEDVIIVLEFRMAAQGMYNLVYFAEILLLPNKIASTLSSPTHHRKRDEKKKKKK